MKVELLPDKYKFKLIDLPKISVGRGCLGVVETGQHIPYDIKRVFYLYDIPENEVRGGHAHKELQQFIVAVSGSFDVILDTGEDKERVSMRGSEVGLHINPMVWVDLENFSASAVCMVLASDRYLESDYYRNYAEYLDALRNKKI